MIYKKFLVKEADTFDPLYFPQLADQVEVITSQIASIPSKHNAEILLTHLRGKELDSQLSAANPPLAEMLAKETLPVKDLQALFESCGKNHKFETQLEEYITNSINS
jgi:hypothetical protein